MGDQFNSDGRMKGDLVTEEVPCDVAAGSCAITVKAPSIVLVFLNDQSLADSTPPTEGPQTFATTAATVSTPWFFPLIVPNSIRRAAYPQYRDH
jgi:hypothetical protein